MVALVGFVVAMRRRVTVAQTASMIDAGLALRNRVATAVELAKLEVRAGRETAADHASAALAARVTAEASAAVADSFGTACLRASRAPREWMALGSATLALALALAFVPAGTVVAAGQGGRGVHGFSGIGTGAQHRGGHDGRLGTHVAQTRTTIAVPLARPRRSSASLNAYLPRLVAKQLKREELASANHAGSAGFKPGQATRSARRSRTARAGRRRPAESIGLTTRAAGPPGIENQPARHPDQASPSRDGASCRRKPPARGYPSFRPSHCRRQGRQRLQPLSTGRRRTTWAKRRRAGGHGTGQPRAWQGADAGLAARLERATAAGRVCAQPLQAWIEQSSHFADA